MIEPGVLRSLAREKPNFASMVVEVAELRIRYDAFPLVPDANSIDNLFSDLEYYLRRGELSDASCELHYVRQAIITLDHFYSALTELHPSLRDLYNPSTEKDL